VVYGMVSGLCLGSRRVFEWFSLGVAASCWPKLVLVPSDSQSQYIFN